MEGRIEGLLRFKAVEKELRLPNFGIRLPQTSKTIDDWK